MILNIISFTCIIGWIVILYDKLKSIYYMKKFIKTSNRVEKSILSFFHDVLNIPSGDILYSDNKTYVYYRRVYTDNYNIYIDMCGPKYKLSILLVDKEILITKESNSFTELHDIFTNLDTYAEFFPDIIRDKKLNELLK